MNQIQLESVLDAIEHKLDILFDSCTGVQLFDIYGYLRDESDRFLKKYIDA